MKRKLLLTTLLVALFVCLFVVSISAAEIPEWTETITYETGDNAIAYKEGFDTTSRVMLSNGDGTYSTYPTNYIIKGTDAVFSQSETDFTALKNASGNTTYTNASIVRLEVPAGFTSVEDRVFRTNAGLNATSMLTIKLPEGITKFGSYVFYNNNVIVEIELPNSLETIEGVEPFIKATSLKKINIPASLTAIPDGAFNSCSSLEEVDFSKANNLLSIGDRAFRMCSSIKSSLILPEGITTIDSCAFFQCTSLTEISIPSTVTSVEDKVFENCTGLETIVCKAQVLGERMFLGCNKVTSLTLENTVSIGAEAFFQCGPKSAVTGTSVIFPETLTTIGAKGLQYFYFETITLPKTLTSVGDSAFSSNYIKKILFTGTEEQASTLIGTAKTYELVNHCEVYYKGVHTFDTATYAFTSFVESAYLDGDCSKCGLAGSRTEVAPIFYDFVYSAKMEAEGSTSRGIVFSYFINKESLAIYNEYNAESPASFGIVAVFDSKITADGTTTNPLNPDGTKVAGAISMDVTEYDIVAIDFVIRGTKAQWEENNIPSSPIYMLGYVKVNDTIYYIGNNTNKVSAQGTNITELKTVTYSELFTE